MCKCEHCGEVIDHELMPFHPSECPARVSMDNDEPIDPRDGEPPDWWFDYDHALAPRGAF